MNRWPRGLSGRRIERRPGATQRWTVKRFAELEHVLVAPLAISPRSVVDALLAKQRLSRRVTRVVTSFSLALPLVAHSDRVAILPRTMADVHAKPFGLELRPVPVAMPPVEMSLAWYLGTEGDPRHAWIRGLLRDAVSAIGLDTGKLGQSATAAPLGIRRGAGGNREGKA